MSSKTDDQAKTEPLVPDDHTTREYDVVDDFWDGPHLRKAGKDTVFKTDEEAKYYTPHTIKLKKDQTEAAALPAPEADTETKSRKTSRTKN